MSTHRRTPASSPAPSPLSASPTASCSRSSPGRALRGRSSPSRWARVAQSPGCACTAPASGCATHSHRRKSDSPEAKSMSGHSPIDSLRRLARVSDTDAAGVFGDAAREELLANLVGLAVRPRSAEAACLAPPPTRARRRSRGSRGHRHGCHVGGPARRHGARDDERPVPDREERRDHPLDLRQSGTRLQGRLQAGVRNRGPEARRLRQRPRRRHRHPARPEATGRLEAARLGPGRRPDPAPGLARRLRQRSQLELPGQRQRRRASPSRGLPGSASRAGRSPYATPIRRRLPPRLRP